MDVPMVTNLEASGILTLGTEGASVLAKQRDLIALGDRLQLFRDADLWLSVQVVNLLKKKAGE
jgi:hypothetical protein